MNRLLLVASLFIIVLAGACGGAKPSSGTAVGGTAATAKVLVNVDAEGVGLGGYDPLAYRKFGKPVAGLPEHSSKHGGATYRFSSTDNVAGFNGAEHAPQYGGYCAYAASLGNLSPSNPLVFEIHDGQLLVFTNTEFRDLFDQDRAGNKAKADAAWPGLVAKHGK